MSLPSPLGGIRVLDMTRVLAGPFCTMMLGDLGATVWKVELPGRGDDTRQWRPPSVGGESCYYLAVNRNKHSIAVNMKHAEGQKIIRQLAAQADVLMENFRPGTLRRMRLDYDSLRTVNRRLIYASLTGYGQTGPCAHRGGYDVVIAAVGGLMHITGERDGAPCKPGVAVTDQLTGLYAHGAILAALLQRAQTGEGQHIDVNLLNTQLATLANIGGNYLNAGWEGRRWGSAHESIVPYQAFRTSDDRYYVVGAGNDAQFAKLCRLLAMDALIADVRYATNAERVANRDSLIDVMQKK